MTWDFSSPMDTMPAEELPDEWVWERLRNHRNRLLASTDWRLVTDAPWDTTPWAAYRQALRDLPDTVTDPRTVEWPEPPNE